MHCTAIRSCLYSLSQLFLCRVSMHGRCHINFGPCLIEFSGVVLSCFFCESRGGRPVPNSTVQFFTLGGWKTLSRSAVFTELFHAVSINCFHWVVSRCLDRLFSLFHAVSIDCFHGVVSCCLHLLFSLFPAVSVDCFHGVVSCCLDQLFSLSCFMLSPSTVFIVSRCLDRLFSLFCFTNCFHGCICHKPKDSFNPLIKAVLYYSVSWVRKFVDCGLGSLKGGSAQNSFVNSMLVWARSFVTQWHAARLAVIF